MPTASLSLFPTLDPAIVETLVQLRLLSVRVAVLAGNSLAFAAILWLILAAPGLTR